MLIGSCRWVNVGLMAGALLMGLSSEGRAVSFQSLGDIPGGLFDSVSFSVSDNGSIIVGQGTTTPGLEAFVWQNGVLTGLGTMLGGGGFASQAFGVSADGSTIVGYVDTASGFEAFQLNNGVTANLGDLPGGAFSSIAYAASNDGSVVVGRGSNDTEFEAFRWENGQMTGLGLLSASGTRSEAFGVSGDGSVVVGYSRTPSSVEAFRWQNGVMTGLGDLVGGSAVNSSANAVSADGSVIVGQSISASGFEAFRWQNGVMAGLGDLAGGLVESSANSTSADGQIVVGKSRTAAGPEAFIWDPVQGMQNLKDVLTNTFNIDLTGWTLSEATDISSDGRHIVGWGINPTGDKEAWHVVLASNIFWASPTSGLWDQATNWGPTGSVTPAQGDIVTIAPNQTLTVQGPTNNVGMDSLTIGGGNGVVTMKLEHDLTLAVTNGVTLSDLLDVSIDPNNTPLYGQQFSVLTYGSRTGTFDKITGTFLSNTRALAPVYDFAGSSQFVAAPNSLTLFVTAPGDANLDLVVDFTDLAFLASNFNKPGGWLNGDFNGDNIVDFTDLAFLASNFNKNFRPLIGTSFDALTAIPEPGTLGVVGILGLLATRRRQR